QQPIRERAREGPGIPLSARTLHVKVITAAERHRIKCARPGGTRMKIARAALIAAVAALGTAGHVYAATPCESLQKLTLDNATVTLAQVIPAGGFKAPGGGGNAGNAERFAKLPSFCRVAATLKPSSDSDIKVEVWMP